MLLLVLGSVALLCFGAALAALVSRSDRLALFIGTASTVLACAVGAVASLVSLVHKESAELWASWPLPIGELHVGIDPLTAFFAFSVFVVSGLGAVYGAGYLQGHIGKQRLGPALVFYGLLVAAMVGVVIARDGILFLVCWELMSVSSFFLVTFEHDREEVRRAGMTYLVASQIGVVLLFVLFALLSRQSGSFDFNRMAVGSPALASVCFLIAVVGFGTKAGFWPLHIWLPEAHPAAPSHVSAVMSGVMIKLGIYGLLRVLPALGPAPSWWGAVLIGIGAVSGVAGVLLALAQRDLKRMLAYSSVENIGIIALGIGVGLVAQSRGAPAIAQLGYSGALLHVLNHGLFKGVLFQAAGSVLHATGTRDMDALGGLSRRMPVTALAFVAGSVAISALPPLNGFVSEYLIYLGALKAAGSLPVGGAVTAFVAVPALALVGGLAAATFVRGFGVVFLGTGRSPKAEHAHEAPASMRWPMIAGATACLAIGMLPAHAVALVSPAAAALSGAPATAMAVGPLETIARLGLLLLALTAGLALVRTLLLRGRATATGPTWGCGYPEPSARMQYTAAAFAEPALSPFESVLPARALREGPDGYFPERARHEEQHTDVARERVVLPVFGALFRALAALRILQHGRVQLYLVYILVTLLGLLAWQLGGLGPRP